MNDLEADDAPAGAEPEPQPEPQTQPDPVEQEPEGTVEATGGQKMVPLSALIEERRKGQGLKAKADQFDQVSGYVHQVRPYIDFLQANPDLMTRASETRPTPAAVEQPVDEGALELARTLDLYTANGEPDVKRAQSVRRMISSEAKQQAEAAVAPLHEGSAKSGASFMLSRAQATMADDGTAPDPVILAELFAKTDPKLAGTEQGAAGLWAMAYGLSKSQGKIQTRGAARPAAQPQQTAVLHTDPAGGRDTRRQPISQLEQNIAKLRGLDDKTYGERTRGFVAGRPSILED